MQLDQQITPGLSCPAGNTPAHVRARIAARGLLAIVVAAFGFFLLGAALTSDPAAAAKLETTADCWDPNSNIGGCGIGSPDVRVGDPVTIYSDINGCSLFDGGCAEVGSSNLQVQAKLNGPGVETQRSTFTDKTSGRVGVTFPNGYNATGAYQPETRICNTAGTSCSDWDRYDILLVNVDLDVGANRNPSGTLKVWQPNDDPAGPLSCDGSGSRDGRSSTGFSFTMDTSDPEGDSVAVEWDFDDDGVVDARTPTSGYQALGAIQATHTYGRTGSWEPKARVLDNHGGVSGWDRYDCATNINLDVVVEEPTVKMKWWAPCFMVLGVCAPGAPDGRPSTAFTFSADFSDRDSDLGGQVVAVEWDFDDNGTVDQAQSITPAGSGTATATYAYGAEGTFEPRIRVKDNDGQWSGWDKYDNLACLSDFECDLDVQAQAPTATMQWWSPCFTVLTVCSLGTPDGRPGTEFTFTADFADPDAAAGSQVTTVEWDFDGNGTVDRTEAVSPPTGSGTVSTKYSYGAPTVVQPQVRFVDNDGAVGNWDKKDIVFIPVDLDVQAQAPTATMQWWSPCFTVLTVCSLGTPDGRPGTEFTFTADFADPDASAGSQVTTVEWDFDGNGTVDRTEAVSPSAGSGTVSTKYSYGAPTVVQPQVRFVDNDGAVGNWDKKDIVFIPVDLDVQAQAPTAKGRFSPYSVTGNDGTTTTLFTFDASESTDADAHLGGAIVQYQWDFNGDGTIDRATITPTTEMTYAQFGFGAGSYAATITVVDNDGMTNTHIFDDNLTGLIPVRVDIAAVCAGDADRDGVPCDFDPDDSTPYSKKLQYVMMDGSQQAVLTNQSLDTAALMPVNISRQQVFFTEMLFGQMVFVNADVFPAPQFSEAMLSLWITKGVGSAPDTAYVEGLGLCLKRNVAAAFGYDFGFCGYKASLDDDQGALEFTDELKISTMFGGSSIGYEGVTFPGSGEFKVKVVE